MADECDLLFCCCEIFTACADINPDDWSLLSNCCCCLYTHFSRTDSRIAQPSRNNNTSRKDPLLSRNGHKPEHGSSTVFTADDESIFDLLHRGALALRPHRVGQRSAARWSKLRGGRDRSEDWTLALSRDPQDDLLRWRTQREYDRLFRAEGRPLGQAGRAVSVVDRPLLPSLRGPADR